VFIISFLPWILSSQRINLLLLFSFSLLYGFFAGVKNKKKFLSGTCADWALWGYLFTASIGLFLASVPYQALKQYLNYVLPGPLLYYLLKNGLFPGKTIKPLLYIIAAFAGIVGLIALLEFFTRHNLLYEGLVVNQFYNYYRLQHRAMATQMVPQVLGAYLAANAAIAYEIITDNKHWMIKIVGITLSAAIISGIIVSAQRSAVLALLVSSMTYFVLSKRHLFLNFIVAVCLVFSLLSLCKNSSLQRIGPRGFLDPEPYVYRLKAASVAFMIAAEHPFFGAGLGSYKLFFDRYSDRTLDRAFKTPENMYLMILAESGVWVFLLFCLFVILLLKAATSFIIKKKTGRQSAVAATTSGIIAILVTMCGYDALYWTTPFYLFWILCGIVAYLVYGEIADETIKA
jgi:hypothetical protein